MLYQFIFFIRLHKSSFPCHENVFQLLWNEQKQQHHVVWETECYTTATCKINANKEIFNSWKTVYNLHEKNDKSILFWKWCQQSQLRDKPIISLMCCFLCECTRSFGDNAWRQKHMLNKNSSVKASPRSNLHARAGKETVLSGVIFAHWLGKETFCWLGVLMNLEVIPLFLCLPLLPLLSLRTQCHCITSSLPGCIKEK